LFRVRELLSLTLLALFACLSMGGLAVWVDLTSAERAFNQRVDGIQRDLAHRFGSAEAALTSLVGLHHASDDLKSYEFAALSRELLAAYPFIRTIAKTLILPAVDRPTFERNMRANGFMRFQVTEREGDERLSRAGNRNITMPVILFEPLEPEFARFVGFDVNSDPALARAVAKAVESGNVAAAEPIELKGIGRGIFVFKAFYLGHAAPQSAVERRTQVSGLIALYLEPKQLIGNYRERYGEYGLRLYQQTDAGPKQGALIYDSPLPVLRDIYGFIDPFVTRASISRQGVSFILEVKGRPDAGSVRAWFVALLVFIGAMAAGLLALALRNHRIGLRHAREAERISRENEKRFRDYAEIASDWFWSTDPKLRFKNISDHITAATGLEPRVFLDQTADDLKGLAPGIEKPRRHLADLRARRAFKDVRYRYVDESDRTQWWSISGKPVFNEAGNFRGYRGTGRNVTAETETRQALLESKEQAELSNRAKTEFIANMSHELRTPLNAIIGFSDMLMLQPFGPLGDDKYLSYAADINGSGGHLLSLINDILDLSKVESGKEELYEEEVNFSSLIASLLTLVTHHADEGGVELILDFDEQLPRLFVDERKIKQVLVNLLSNAIKFTKPGGSVTLTWWRGEDGGFFFSIKDTGIGIAKEDIPIAFSKFLQIDGDLNREYDGTGLGLPLAKGLVELHGGRLEIDSRLGVGTTVTVCLPESRILPNNREEPADELGSHTSGIAVAN
jgi:PAS domain S-box-containing protein